MNVSKEAIESVRRSHDLVETIRSRGVELRQVGRSFMGLCPFHEDHTPSLAVDPAKQLWNCLGACGANGGKSGGDVIAFVMKKDGMTFLESLRQLGYVEPPMPGKRSMSEALTPKVEKEAVTLSAGRRKLLRRVVDHYHRTFRERPEGQDYLERRGLTSADMLAAFEVGYSDGSLVRMLDQDTAASLRAIGILTAKGSELFHGCVVFPLALPDVGVVGLYGRQVGRQQHLYLPGPHRGVFHWQAMKGSQEVIVTESVIDALSLFQAGFQNVTAVYGANGLTTDHLALLERFRVRRVLLCLDNDDAGSKATESIAARVKDLGIETADVRLPGAKDPNALLILLGAEGMIPKVRKALEEARGSLAPASPSRPGQPRVSREEGKGTGWIVAFPARSYRVRGLSPNGFDQLRVNLHLGNGGGMHVETLDLYSQRARSGWLRAAAHEVGAKEDDLTREVNVLIGVLEAIRLDLLKSGDTSSGKIEIPDQEREAALRTLRSPNLIDLVLDDFEHGGFVGERTALSVGYLAATSRLLEEPLGVFIVSRSGAGKSSLQDAVCDFVPDEYLAKYTRVTGQALFYGDSESLVNKVLAVDEERGAAEASYSLRVLQSAQELSIVTTETDPDTGKHRAHSHKVKGPVSIFLTTASPEALDFETRNRFIQVGIDESGEQTRRILARQRDMETLDGIVRRVEAQAIRLKQHNIQRLLRPLHVVNPFAPLLRYPDQLLLMRREQKKYLSLIKAIALLHQHQREVKRVKRGDVELEYVEVIPGDITLANRLAREVLGHSLDELAPPTRDLLKQLVKLAHENGRSFTRKDVKDATGWTDWSVREHLGQLVKMEYVVMASGSNGQRMTYDLLFDGDPDEEQRYLAGLVDVEELLARQGASVSEALR